jgi:hypothetical protein
VEQTANLVLPDHPTWNNCLPNFSFQMGCASRTHDVNPLLSARAVVHRCPIREDDMTGELHHEIVAARLPKMD